MATASRSLIRNIGVAISGKREALRLTQEQLAKKAHIALHRLIEIESGLVDDIDLDTLMMLCPPLQVTLEQLLASPDRDISDGRIIGLKFMQDPAELA